MSRSKTMKKKMKAIVLKFLTKNGEKAYHQVDAEGESQSKMDRAIGNRVASDHILSQDPLIVKIKIKIGWLAVKVNLPEQIEKGLLKYGAVKGTDYTMEVKR